MVHLVRQRWCIYHVSVGALRSHILIATSRDVSASPYRCWCLWHLGIERTVSIDTQTMDMLHWQGDVCPKGRGNDGDCACDVVCAGTVFVTQCV